MCDCIAGIAAAVTGELAAKAKAASVSSVETIPSSLLISVGMLEDVLAITVTNPASL